MRDENTKPIRVLVVDDSALVRKTVRELVAGHGSGGRVSEGRGFEVVGVAGDGREALTLVEALRPDVVTLDLNMPVMDGMTCLGHLVREHRQPVVVFSSLAQEKSFETFKALALGAIDFVTKPGAGRYLAGLDQLGEELRAKIRTAATIPRSRVRQAPVGRRRARPPNSLARSAPPLRLSAAPPRLRAVGALGGSTGATVALEALLARLPADLPAALAIVQHLPKGFALQLARYLDSVCEVTVKVPDDGEPLAPATVYLAPGDVHLRLQRQAAGIVFRTDPEGATERGFRPSINVLFYSLAVAQRHRAFAALLSGMGDDGVEGLQAVRRLGGATAVQDRESSVVFGMAARALEQGATRRALGPEELAAQIVAWAVVEPHLMTNHRDLKTNHRL